MDKIVRLKVEIEVGKETYELANGITGFIGAIRQALADGFQIGDDLPDIMSAAVTHLVQGVQGWEQLDDEAMDRSMFIQTMGIFAGDLYDVISEPTKAAAAVEQPKA